MGKPKCKNASRKNVSAHHGTRKFETLTIESFDSVKFTCGNPNVKIQEGIIHLYKEDSAQEKESYDTLCLLSVPTVISCAELINFCTSFANRILRIRILRSTSPGIYFSLIKFHDSNAAKDFYEMYKGVLINPDNPNSICNAVYVESVTYLATEKGGFMPHAGQTELPTCPICLERMDDLLDGILTILCDHSFHSECLMKWPDIKCPVCRHIQSPISPDSSLTCSECNDNGDLWMCLICGNLGCGRYDNKHAMKHFEETSHTFSIKIGTSYVWDYAGDNFVHRLISSVDGKPIECVNEHQDSLDDKIESLKLEVVECLD